MASVTVLAAMGCESQPSDDELQALLHDEPLGVVTRSALSTGSGSGGTSPATDGGAPSSMGAGGSGSAGTTGFGGTTGSAGAFGGSTGFAGTTGIAGSKDIGGSTGFGGTPLDGGMTGIAGARGTAGSGFGGSMGPGGTGFDGGPPPVFGPLGVWSFDDCNPDRTNLFDSGPNSNTAFRAVSVACVTGVSNEAVSLADKDNDIIYVPDQPNFTFGGGVTVAGWFNATSTNQTRTLFRKRDDGDSSAFALVLNGGKFQFVVNLGNGRAAAATAPSKAEVGRWTHVGATYDGGVVRLYLDGKEVANKKASGTIAPALGPFLMGNDGSKRLWAGMIDSAFFDARALSPDEMLALTCIRRPLSLTPTPLASEPTTTAGSATFDVAIVNNDSASCTPDDYFFEAFAAQTGVNINPTFQFLPQVAPGTTTHISMSVTGTDDLDTGTYPVSLFAFDENNGASAQSSVDFNFVATGCRVSKPHELMITSTSVVDDPVRTSTAASTDPRAGVWTFKHLVENMAPTPADAPAMVEAMLTTFTGSETINGFTVAPRPGMQSTILSQWPRTASGQLDLAQAPFTLQAIVNRFDLRNLDNGDAGEGRFVFAFNFPGSPFPLQATMIFEYKLPAATEDDVMGWANAWHGLGALTFPSEDYNAALQAITERFAGRGARPSHPNGNAINAVRTNEIDFGNNGLWELREFVLSPDTGMLVPTTIKLTPDLSFNNTPTLASYINQNEAAIIAETHTVPDQFMGVSFQGGAVFNDAFTLWNAPGINNSEARFHFALNTCNGCHSEETNTIFLQISPRFPGGEAGLSPFLQGTTVFDRFSGEVRTLGDLSRRQTDLKGIVCPPEPGNDGGAGGAGGTGSMGAGGIGGTTGIGGRGVGGSTGRGGTVGTGGRGVAGSTGAGGTVISTGGGGSIGLARPTSISTATLPVTTSLRKGISRVH